jgi:hypothetical protein
MNQVALPPLPNRWLYIDFNSYFASVEQQLNPALRGRPVAVVAVMTDATSAIAASYEAKAYGIRTGTPIWEAKAKCPELICVLGRHEAYVDYHHRAIAEVENHIPVSMVCSIDEIACRLMSNENSYARACAIAASIKRGLAQNVGEYVKCSIGIAPNRYLAKVATDMQKPDGLTFLNAEDLPHKLYSLTLRDLPGIGQNMEKRINARGIWDMKSLCAPLPFITCQQIKQVTLPTARRNKVKQGNREFFDADALARFTQYLVPHRLEQMQEREAITGGHTARFGAQAWAILNPHRKCHCPCLIPQTAQAARGLECQAAGHIAGLVGSAQLRRHDMAMANGAARGFQLRQLDAAQVIPHALTPDAAPEIAHLLGIERAERFHIPNAAGVDAFFHILPNTR